MDLFHVLAAPISVTNMVDAMAEVKRRAATRSGGYVCVADVHSVMRAREMKSHLDALSGAFLVLPDGAPVALVGRLRGVANLGRVPGPDFFAQMCSRDEGKLCHFFLGGENETLVALKSVLLTCNPELRIGGTYSPPFRPLFDGEATALSEMICASNADIVWVGLGCPKQERWMADNHSSLDGAVCVGVGAAFNFLAGDVERAPRLLRSLGLEWAFRLYKEPVRLWRRYVVLAPLFVLLNLLDFENYRRPKSTYKE